MSYIYAHFASRQALYKCIQGSRDCISSQSKVSLYTRLKGLYITKKAKNLIYSRFGCLFIIKTAKYLCSSRLRGLAIQKKSTFCINYITKKVNYLLYVCLNVLITLYTRIRGLYINKKAMHIRYSMLRGLLTLFSQGFKNQTNAPGGGAIICTLQR